MRDWLRQNIDLRRAGWTVLGLVAFAVLLVTAGFVNAAVADGPTKRSQIAAPVQQPAAVPRTWTGLYGGGFGGFGLGELSPSGVPVGISSSGPLAGVTAGITVQTGQVVFGAEVSYAWVFGDLKDVGVKNETEYTGRFGVAMGQALPYLHGSFVQTDVDGLGKIEGWKFGPGVELRLGDAGWSIDLRGGYAVYDIESIAPGIDANMLWGRVGLNRRFDMPAGWFGQ